MKSKRQNAAQLDLTVIPTGNNSAAVAARAAAASQQKMQAATFGSAADFESAPFDSTAKFMSGPGSSQAGPIARGRLRREGRGAMAYVAVKEDHSGRRAARGSSGGAAASDGDYDDLAPSSGAGGGPRAPRGRQAGPPLMHPIPTRQRSSARGHSGYTGGTATGGGSMLTNAFDADNGNGALTPRGGGDAQGGSAPGDVRQQQMADFETTQRELQRLQNELSMLQKSQSQQLLQHQQSVAANSTLASQLSLAAGPGGAGAGSGGQLLSMPSLTSGMLSLQPQASLAQAPLRPAPSQPLFGDGAAPAAPGLSPGRGLPLLPQASTVAGGDGDLALLASRTEVGRFLDELNLAEYQMTFYGHGLKDLDHLGDITKNEYATDLGLPMGAALVLSKRVPQRLEELRRGCAAAAMPPPAPHHRPLQVQPSQASSGPALTLEGVLGDADVTDQS